MKKKNLILLLLLIVGMISCSDNVDTIEEANLKYSLVSPDNVRIAKSAEDLNSKITDGKGTISNVNYIKTDKNSVIAIIDYKIDSEEISIILISGIENFKFPKDAVIKLGNFSSNISKTNGEDDIYISCIGKNCCAPGGTYNPNTQLFTTFCKCESGDNSGCTMKVSRKPPEISQN
ncbi:hypothetical protein [Kordia jejudonensis]|uniref:hypothetical protein n=1 Tax=Kordia jejudonensis TaxID=1348245 RepID=UPI000629B6D3|nr:hypothetical protein [Kordia jejudonensis]